MIKRELGFAQFGGRHDDLAPRCSKIATSTLFLRQRLCRVDPGAVFHAGCSSSRAVKTVSVALEWCQG